MAIGLTLPLVQYVPKTTAKSVTVMQPLVVRAMTATIRTQLLVNAQLAHLIVIHAMLMVAPRAPLITSRILPMDHANRALPNVRPACMTLVPQPPNATQANATETE
jgi:hypothetical protein